jgi:hypothetical protein
VLVASASQLKEREKNPGRNQQAADYRILSVEHHGAELKTNRHDDRPEHHRHQHVGHPRQSRKAGHPREWVAASTAHHRQRNPVIGEDRVSEPDSRGGRDQRRGCAAHSRSPGALDASDTGAIVLRHDRALQRQRDDQQDAVAQTLAGPPAWTGGLLPAIDPGGSFAT